MTEWNYAMLSIQLMIQRIISVVHISILAVSIKVVMRSLLEHEQAEDATGVSGWSYRVEGLLLPRPASPSSALLTRLGIPVQQPRAAECECKLQPAVRLQDNSI